MTDASTSPTPTPFAVAADEGEPRWFLGQLLIVRAGGEQTGGAFALAELLLGPGPASPLHVQPGEDETFHVLDGDLTVHVDGRELTASAGATVVIPRGTPHAFRVDSDSARLLVLNTPAGHEEFFLAMSEPAPRRELPPAPEGPPDMGRMARAAADAGFEILGPPPF